MTALDLLHLNPSAAPAAPDAVVAAPDLPLQELLELLLGSPSGHVGVRDESGQMRAIDLRMALAACSQLMPPRRESSQIEIICTPAEFSASSLARAVEDADAHLLDLYTMPAAHGNLRVLLRVSRMDPAPVAHSLERYGFTVASEHGRVNSDSSQAQQRIAALRRFFDI